MNSFPFSEMMSYLDILSNLVVDRLLRNSLALAIYSGTRFAPHLENSKVRSLLKGCFRSSGVG